MITRVVLRRAGVVFGMVLASMLVSIRPSAAETEAETYLRDPNLCWIFEVLDEGTGTWRLSADVTGRRVMRISDGPVQRRDLATFRDGRVNKTNPSEPSIYHSFKFSDGTYLTSRVRNVPCPPDSTFTGYYFGVELVKNWGGLRSTERRDATDVVTNLFRDHADPVGGGFLIGYKFAPWANSVIVSPFGSFDFIDAPVNHTFAGGSYLGTTAKFMGTFGVKAGPQVGAGVWLYGIAGVSVLNETLNVNFIPVSSSQSAWVPGGTLGVGGAFQPSVLQRFGHRVSVFAEYQHTWWQSANFKTPAASPLFNYNFRREDDVVKVGFTVDLGAPPPAPAPSYPVKALPQK
jgi:hypothetical protein